MKVLIGPISSAAGKEGIARLLAAAPGSYRNAIRSERCDSWQEVLARLSAEPFDVMIAEFGAGSPAIDRLFQLQHKLSVIQVDLVAGTADIHVVERGSERLMRLAEWLLREAGLTTANETAACIVHPAPQLSVAANELCVVEATVPVPQPDIEPEREAVSEPDTESEAERMSAGLLNAAAIPPPVQPPPPPPPFLAPPPADSAARIQSMHRDPYADAGAQLAAVALWLELKLGIALARSEDEAAGQDPHNCAVPLSRARALLGARIAALPLPDRIAECEALDASLTGRSVAAGALPLNRLAAAFDLDRIELQLLYFALAPDMDGRLAQMFGFLADDLGQRRPNASILAALVAELSAPWHVLQRLSGDRPLARFGLIRLLYADVRGAPDTQIPLALQPDMSSFLLGRPASELGEWKLVEPADPATSGFDLQAAPVVAAAHAACPGPIVRFAAAQGEELWLADQLAAVGISTVIGTLAPRQEATAEELKDKLRLFARQARLADAVLIVAGLDSVPEPVRAHLCAWLAASFAAELKLLVLQGRHIDPIWVREAPGGVLEIGRDLTSREERATIWARAAADRGLALSGESASELAATFAFKQVQAETAVALALGGGTDSSEITQEGLREAARLVSKASAPESVRWIETGLGWDDIILPPPIAAELRSIPSHVRHADTVWGTWGFGERMPYGQGIAALFAGPSGTGKTMAAQIIARELGVALFQVDPAKAISKYIGETEKALDRIFDAAEAASAVLLFEDADALFGKRSEGKDAHDRYANLQVAYLLQRIEAYRGITILTTNLKKNLDAALLRRLRFIVDFPMPDAENRLAIWTRMFPEDAPVAKDVDVSLLARQLPLSGANIRQSVVNAAFNAAEDGGVIRMRHLVDGTRAELALIGKVSAGRNLPRLLAEDEAAMLEP
ncbi:MAG TPA: ATP-binding protein [Allosphingosinicella sp.]